MYRLIFCLLIGLPFSVTAEEIVEAKDGEEIRVVVPLVKNLDKKVIFEEPVAVAVNTAFQEVIRTQSIGNTVYFTAKQKTDRRFRIVGKGQQSKKIYTLLVSVSENDNDGEAIRVVSAGSPALSARRGNQSKTLSPVDLVRFVAQTLYAPTYAIEPVKGVRMVANTLPDDLDFLYQGASLDISPISAYRGGKWTVTALNVINKSRIESHPLDANSLMGFYGRVDAEGVVAQHNYLGVSDEDNQSVVYIVTEGPLAKNVKVGM